MRACYFIAFIFTFFLPITAQAKDTAKFKCNPPDFFLQKKSHEEFHLTGNLETPSDGYTYTIEDIPGRSHLGISKYIVLTPSKNPIKQSSGKIKIDHYFFTDQSPVHVEFKIKKGFETGPATISCNLYYSGD